MVEIFSSLNGNFLNFVIKEIYFHWFIKIWNEQIFVELLTKIIIFNLFEFILVRKYFVSFINILGIFFLNFKNYFEI